MAQSGMGEIKAVEARLALAKKANDFAAATFRDAEAANDVAIDLLNLSKDACDTKSNELATFIYDTARDSLKAVRKLLEKAKKGLEEAAVELKAAEDATDAVNKKFEVVVLGDDDEHNECNEKDESISRKRYSSVRDDVEDGEINEVNTRRVVRRQNDPPIRVPAASQTGPPTTPPSILKENIFHINTIDVVGCGSVQASGRYIRSNEMYFGFPVFAHTTGRYQLRVSHSPGGCWVIVALEERWSQVFNGYTYMPTLRLEPVVLYSYNNLPEPINMAPLNNKWSNLAGFYPPPMVYANRN
eukprot:scaffold105689_cov39-Cyclotella_meneghiniana.AAC.5